MKVLRCADSTIRSAMLEGNYPQSILGRLREPSARKKGRYRPLSRADAYRAYFPDDLLLDNAYHRRMRAKIGGDRSLRRRDCSSLSGLPRRNPEEKKNRSTIARPIFADGKLLGFKNKTLLPTYDVFDERRYFEPGTEEPIWEYLGRRIARDDLRRCVAAFRNGGLYALSARSGPRTEEKAARSAAESFGISLLFQRGRMCACPSLQPSQRLSHVPSCSAIKSGSMISSSSMAIASISMKKGS